MKDPYFFLRNCKAYYGALARALDVLQAGKGKEAIESWSKAGPAGGQDHEVRYEAMKKAVKKVGTSRKRVERRLGRRNLNEGSGLERYRILQ